MSKILRNRTLLLENKQISILLSILLILSFSFYLYSWFMGIEQVINWQVISELADTSAILDRFKIANQSYEIPIKIYYLSEQYIASNMKVNFIGAYFWLTGYLLVLSMLMALATKLKSYWYYGSMALLILVLVSLNFDSIFEVYNYFYSGIILSVFIAISYYFFAFRAHTDLIKIFFSFLIFFLAIVTLVHFYSKGSLPFLYLSSQTIPSAMILACFFIFFISYEIVFIILSVSVSGGAKNSFINFTIGTFIFLMNVLLTHLHNINYLNWEMLYLSPFLVLILSIISGLWGLNKKINSFSPVIGSFSNAYILYMGGAIVTLGMIAYSFSTGNDPIVEAFEDMIIYSHLVMGFCFFAYVMLNFLPLFRQKLDISKVIFKPLQFELYYFRGAAILVIFAMLVNNQFFPIMQSFAGQYNSLGDYSTATKQYKLAEVYYKTALGYERQNHKSNYALASLAAIQGDNPTAGSYFRLAVQKKPTEYAYSALSNCLIKEDLFFEAMFALKDGLKVFPKSGELQNNLALLFSKSKSMDSTYSYLQKAKLNATNKNIPETNLLWLTIKDGNKVKQNETIEQSNKSDYNSFNANILALNLVSEKNEKNEIIYDFKGDTALSMADFTWLYNQSILNNKNGIKSKFPFVKLMENESNFNISKDLQMAYILNEYYAGNKLLALDVLSSNATLDSSIKNTYNRTLFNTLLKKAKEIPSNIDISKIITKNDAEKALTLDPLNENIIEKAVQVYNKSKEEKRAYEVIINTLPWMRNPKIQKLYILQCFKIHMNSYAKDGMNALKLMNINEYNSFLPVYQAQIALVEKSNKGFN